MRCVCLQLCFNPRSPRGGATQYLYQCSFGLKVSIHAPHEGERLLRLLNRARVSLVSIHAPHEGERRPLDITRILANAFQSTLPTRGSDACAHPTPAIGAVSIHAPHEGERPGTHVTRLRVWIGFNPRSPRGGATCAVVAGARGEKFQSTLPTRGSDAPVSRYELSLVQVSIHAPHEGERLTKSAADTRRQRVSIHAPHEGERRS